MRSVLSVFLRKKAPCCGTELLFRMLFAHDTVDRIAVLREKFFVEKVMESDMPVYIDSIDCAAEHGAVAYFLTDRIIGGETACAIVHQTNTAEEFLKKYPK